MAINQEAIQLNKVFVKDDDKLREKKEGCLSNVSFS